MKKLIPTFGCSATDLSKIQAAIERIEIAYDQMCGFYIEADEAWNQASGALEKMELSADARVIFNSEHHIDANNSRLQQFDLTLAALARTKHRIAAGEIVDNEADLIIMNHVIAQIEQWQITRDEYECASRSSHLWNISNVSVRVKDAVAKIVGLHQSSADVDTAVLLIAMKVVRDRL